MPITVSEIHRYPMKSMCGERINEGYITWTGLVGDRMYTVNRKDGTVITAKMKEGHALLQCSATYTEGYEGVGITLPDGTSYSQLCWPYLSELLGQPVTTERAKPWPRPTNYRPPFSLRPGVNVDSSPLHIVTRSSLESLGAALGVSSSELVQRFRPNLVIEGAEAAFVETTWVDHHLMVGDTQIYIRKETDRCPLITAPQLGLDGNPKILREVTQNLNKNFGVYAVVISPGVIRTGDTVTIQS